MTSIDLLLRCVLSFAHTHFTKIQIFDLPTYLFWAVPQSSLGSCLPGYSPLIKLKFTALTLCIFILVDTSYRYLGFPGGCSFPGKETAYHCRRHKRTGFSPWVGKIPWSRAWQPTPVFLLGESHGQRSLTGCSPWTSKSRTQLSD